jgi:type II secretory pathway pseudopilin PulG
MAVCALIAILATVALPSLFGEGRKAKGSAEVQAMFQDIRSRMDTHMQEIGVYPASIGEGTLHPALPAGTAQALTPLPATWTAAKIRITNSSEVFCGYTWVTGTANNSTGVGAEATAFGFTVPETTSWYYILARCDLDDDATVDSYYFTSSVDPTVLKRNEGH